jgi:type IV pilus assembly protein PilK
MTMRLPAHGPGLTPDGAGAHWSDLIALRCGVALRDAQVGVLADFVQRRVREQGLRGASDYYGLLEAEAGIGPEWTALMDRLVSHETSFFRHGPTFDAVRDIIADLRSGHGRALALWSAGCSTGEEAYSLAITALEDRRGRPFTVWGTDISRSAITTARRGCYGERAMAAVPPRQRRLFFHAIDAGGAGRYSVRDEVRRPVRFVAANLCDASASVLSYDVIVCQNVLIYFAPRAIPGLLATLAARLYPGGYLLLGPGESPVAWPAGLEPVQVAGARAFYRTRRAIAEVRS